ncbi:MAG TPA: hypothetical protein VJ579_02475 [Candidatus Paceibacterota bacterium]|nr:hypothetical protein [Candidatus Paceibacterota bacterium]
MRSVLLSAQNLFKNLDGICPSLDPRERAGEVSAMRIAATLEVDEGARIVSTIERAISSAKLSPDYSASFTMSGVTITVRDDSSPRLIFDEFLRALNGRLEGEVGPYPKDIPIEDLSVPLLRADIEALLAEAPPIEVVDEERWLLMKETNVDNCGYGQSMVAYAERWARLMQLRLASGRKIDDVAGRASFEVDFDGIRPLVVRRAVIELSLHWKYGRELLAESWHARGK